MTVPYGMLRRKILPKRSWSVLATCESAGLSSSSTLSSFVRPITVLLPLDRERFPGGRVVRPLLQEQDVPPAPGSPSPMSDESGASMSVGFSRAVDEAGQVAIVLVGPARSLVGNRGEAGQRGNRRARDVEDTS